MKYRVHTRHGSTERNLHYEIKWLQFLEEMYGHKPEVVAIHAGLECGLFYKKMEGLDCVSLGPDMKDIHTSEEVLSIAPQKEYGTILYRFSKI